MVQQRGERGREVYSEHSEEREKYVLYGGRIRVHAALLVVQ